MDVHEFDELNEAAVKGWGEPYFQDDAVTLWHGDALEVLRELPDSSVDCCVTSPPYFGLRDYGVEGQQGLESSPLEYITGMVTVFAEVRRVLADDGTLWLNIGDSYSSASGGAPTPKNLLGIPWRLALAVQYSGWILRNDIIWAKPNAMPESVTDRLSTKHEHLFMFAKQPRYFFDLDAIREPQSEASERRLASGPVGIKRDQSPGEERDRNVVTELAAGRNPGDVWSIPTQPYPGAHFAVMPQALASRAIQAGCKPGGTVLDPFSGSGTTGLAAAKHGRKYVGIDLNSDYLDLSLRTRLAQPALMELD